MRNSLRAAKRQVQGLRVGNRERVGLSGFQLIRACPTMALCPGAPESALRLEAGGWGPQRAPTCQRSVLLSKGKQIPETSLNFCAEIVSWEENIKVSQAVIMVVTGNN